ncbi:MAG: hypothetical protein A2Y63_05245 [Candidatus Riflebacteria bacterium RBG_13_59_9]|nr:MAG: hypothetical protein A2Y63_05245 [Candidatus Riflebacteria bacterium RBG_13_59_9]
MRINRALAKAGCGSRRAVEELVRAGKVRVNGVVVTELSAQVDPEKDRLVVSGKKLRSTTSCKFIAFYKPRGVLSTWKDERDRKCLADYFPARGSGRVFAVGRLDRDSEGLLLITNDGNLAHSLTHPSAQVPRIYEVVVSPPPQPSSVESLAGITELEDGPVQPAGVRLCRPRAKLGVLEITVKEGRNRLVRRLLAAQGFVVRRLTRRQFGGVKLDKLRPGTKRELSARELALLRELAAVNQLKPTSGAML